MSISDSERDAVNRMLADPELAALASEEQRSEINERNVQRALDSIPPPPELALPEDLLGPQSYIPSEWSEQGLASVFVNLNFETLKYVPAWGWMVWDGKVWHKDAKELAQKRWLTYADTLYKEVIQRELTDTSESTKILKKWVVSKRTAKTMRAVLELAAPMMLAKAEEFDADPWQLNTLGGIVNLQNGTIVPHDPDARCTMICDADPKQDPPDNDWEDFIKTVTCNNLHLEEYLRALVGMAAVGKVYHEGIAIFFGGGSNGKSTLTNPIRRVLGSYATTISPETLMVAQNREEVRGLANLAGKRLAIASETEEGQRLSASVVKRLASTDPVTARMLYKESFDFTPTHTLIMPTNHLPRIGSQDHGIWRRIFAVPFNARFALSGDGATRTIMNYGDLLVEKNSSEILRWIIQGAAEFYTLGNKLPPLPKVIADATEEYRSGEDWLHNFLNECCEVDGESTVKSSYLYATYRNWAERTGEYRRKVQDFTEALNAAGFERYKTLGTNYWRGLKVVDEDPGPEYHR